MSFTEDLSFKDHVRLRKIVKQVIFRYKSPIGKDNRIHQLYSEENITDYEADKWINVQGPKVLGKLIKFHVDKGNV